MFECVYLTGEGAIPHRLNQQVRTREYWETRKDQTWNFSIHQWRKYKLERNLRKLTSTAYSRLDSNLDW
jgi:hypothetical protein